MVVARPPGSVEAGPVWRIGELYLLQLGKRKERIVDASGRNGVSCVGGTAERRVVQGYRRWRGRRRASTILFPSTILFLQLWRGFEARGRVGRVPET